MSVLDLYQFMLEMLIYKLSFGEIGIHERHRCRGGCRNRPLNVKSRGHRIAVSDRS